MTILISYDISNNKRRNKISDYLKYKGLIRLQKSVFAGKISRYELDKIRKHLSHIVSDLEEESDKIIINTIDKKSIVMANFIGSYEEDLLQELKGVLKVKIY